jgi:2-amino-4-hydroxy-6-hydroxymethyldihydropteridine diphosphokinase
MVEVYIGLGSNLGDRAANIWEAARRLEALPGCDLVCQSPLYETEPVGSVSQGWFLNAALRLELEAETDPLVLLMAVKEIERSIGRRPGLPWGPRIIDIDLLLYEDVGMETEELTLPHPELWNRKFVLAPLLDVMPDGELRRRVEQGLKDLGDEGPEVRPYSPPDGGHQELAS